MMDSALTNFENEVIKLNTTYSTYTFIKSVISLIQIYRLSIPCSEKIAYTQLFNGIWIVIESLINSFFDQLIPTGKQKEETWKYSKKGEGGLLDVSVEVDSDILMLDIKRFQEYYQSFTPTTVSSVKKMQILVKEGFFDNQVTLDGKSIHKVYAALNNIRREIHANFSEVKSTQVDPQELFPKLGFILAECCKVAAYNNYIEPTSNTSFGISLP